MIITPNDAYRDIGIEVYLDGKRIDRCTMVDTDRRIVRVGMDFWGVGGPIYEDICGDLELKLILYEDETSRVKEIITDLEQIEAALTLLILTNN